MSTTIRESILAELKTTLAGIAVANGYNNTIANVQRWMQRGNSLVQVPCIIIGAGPEEKEPIPNPEFTCRLSVNIEVWTRQAETDAQATDTILNSLLGDVEKCLMQDITRGGYAENTTILGNVPFETEQGAPHAGIIIQVEIIYQHNAANPAQYP